MKDLVDMWPISCSEKAHLFSLRSVLWLKGLKLTRMILSERNRLVYPQRSTRRPLRLQSPQHPRRPLILHTNRERDPGHRQRDMLYMHLLFQNRRDQHPRHAATDGPLGNVQFRPGRQDS